MVGGFSFCGVDINDIGLEYAPENVDTYVFKPATIKINDGSVEGHDGGYFYGTNIQPKDFTLRCYYESSDVRCGIMSTIHHYFKIGKTGKLIFSKRPWCWYSATVIDVDVSNMLNYKNGFIIIRMRAYYPFSRCDNMNIDSYSSYEQDVKNNSGLLSSSFILPPASLIQSGSTITAQQSFMLYNPGTQRAKVAIEIAGNCGSGVTISNTTTGQTCKFVAISAANTTNLNKYVVTDAMNGKTIMVDSLGNSSLAFLYHDNGYIELDPSFPIYRDISFNLTSGSKSLNTNVNMSEDVVGKYIYIDGSWYKIISRPIPTRITTAYTASTQRTITTNIVKMNELLVTPDDVMSLTRLNFIYSPTFS